MLFVIYPITYKVFFTIVIGFSLLGLLAPYYRAGYMANDNNRLGRHNIPV